MKESQKPPDLKVIPSRKRKICVKLRNIFHSRSHLLGATGRRKAGP